MSNRNGLGPNNEGPRTGRGLGGCKTTSKTTSKTSRPRLGLGRGRGRGLGRGLGRRSR